jgi:hypothetical protein
MESLIMDRRTRHPAYPDAGLIMQLCISQFVIEKISSSTGVSRYLLQNLLDIWADLPRSTHVHWLNKFGAKECRLGRFYCLITP